MATDLPEDKKDKLRELKSNLDKHIKQVKDKELGESKPVFDEEEFVEKMKENKEKNGPPYSTLKPTPEQRVSSDLNKRIDELEERVSRLESLLIRQLTKGGSQQ